jgi:hypothetical protein
MPVAVEPDAVLVVAAFVVAAVVAEVELAVVIPALLDEGVPVVALVVPPPVPPDDSLSPQPAIRRKTLASPITVVLKVMRIA